MSWAVATQIFIGMIRQVPGKTPRKIPLACVKVKGHGYELHKHWPDVTAVLQNLAKNSNVNFSACVKFHVENEWEILRMCEIDV